MRIFSNCYVVDRIKAFNIGQYCHSVDDWVWKTVYKNTQKYGYEWRKAYLYLIRLGNCRKVEFESFANANKSVSYCKHRGMRVHKKKKTYTVRRAHI